MIRRRARWSTTVGAAAAIALLVGACNPGGGSDGGSDGGSPTTVVPYVYVSIGDSFASGEGAPPYVDAGPCRRSPRAWELLLDADSDAVASVDQHGCSGATTKHLIGERPSLGLPSQIPTDPDPSVTLVTVVIGGNDIGFGDLVQRCVLVDCPDPASAEITAALAALHTQLVDGVYPKLRRAYPNARLVHVGYPRLTPNVGGPGLPVTCSWLLHGDQERAAGIVRALDDEIRTAAQASAVTYVDVFDVLDGHELCRDDSWVRPIGSVGQVHPNADGQRAIEAEVADALGIPL